MQSSSCSNIIFRLGEWLRLLPKVFYQPEIRRWFQDLRQSLKMHIFHATFEAPALYLGIDIQSWKPLPLQRISCHIFGQIFELVEYFALDSKFLEHLSGRALSFARTWLESLQGNLGGCHKALPESIDYVATKEWVQLPKRTNFKCLRTKAGIDRYRFIKEQWYPFNQTQSLLLRVWNHFLVFTFLCTVALGFGAHCLFGNAAGIANDPKPSAKAFVAIQDSGPVFFWERSSCRNIVCENGAGPG